MNIKYEIQLYRDTDNSYPETCVIQNVGQRGPDSGCVLAITLKNPEREIQLAVDDLQLILDSEKRK